MTGIKFKLLINRFDKNPEISEHELSDSTSISGLKEIHFSEELKQGHKIRFIHCGSILKDNDVLTNIKGYKEGETLVLTVFVTKPDKPESPEPTESRNDLWKWSTSAWIVLVATLWCYKFRLADSFKSFPTMVLYLFTFLCIKMIFTRVVGNSRVE